MIEEIIVSAIFSDKLSIIIFSDCSSLNLSELLL